MTQRPDPNNGIRGLFNLAQYAFDIAPPLTELISMSGISD